MSMSWACRHGADGVASKRATTTTVIVIFDFDFDFDRPHHRHQYPLDVRYSLLLLSIAAMASRRPLSSAPSSVRKSASTPSSVRGQLPPRAPNSMHPQPSTHHHSNGLYTPCQLGLTRYSPGREARLQQQGILLTIDDNEEDLPESQQEESQVLLTPPPAPSTLHRSDNFDSQILGITVDDALKDAVENNHDMADDVDIDYGTGGGFNDEDNDEEEVVPHF